MNRCLYCYQPLYEDADFHAKCWKTFFGTKELPTIDFSLEEIGKLALSVVQSQIAVTGVQPKLSLQLSSGKGAPRRFTTVGVLGDYILKPATKEFTSLPENESVTMHLARLAKIETVPFSLIRLKDNTLAYITKRIDRANNTKLPMEDMCQLTSRLTEHKYRGSYEQIAKAIAKYTQNKQFDMISFYEQLVFSFLTGNTDMHLKNFSLIHLSGRGWSLAPAYDLLSTQLVLHDAEELALTLNGKKNNLRRSDFEEAMIKAGLKDSAVKNLFNRFKKAFSKWEEFIAISFLPKDKKHEYQTLIDKRIKRLY